MPANRETQVTSPKTRPTRRSPDEKHPSPTDEHATVYTEILTDPKLAQSPVKARAAHAAKAKAAKKSTTERATKKTAKKPAKKR